MKERSEISNQYKWDLSNRCKNDDDFYKRLEAVAKECLAITKYQSTLNDEDKLFECLEFNSAICQKFMVLYNYCSNRQNENSLEQQANEMVEKAVKYITEYDVNSSFIVPEISSFCDDKLTKLKQNPRFKNYDRFFEKIIRKKSHYLTASEEKLLSGTNEFSDGFSDVFYKFNTADIKFDDVINSKGEVFPLNHSNYIEHMESTDAVLRKNTFITLHGEYGKFINFLSANYISHIKANAFRAKVRNYPSSLSASIHNEEASEEVYNMLVKKVHDNFDLFYDYMELKRKLLNLQEISIADCFAPIVSELKKQYSFEEAIELIKQATAPLGKDYIELIDKAKNEKWIDVFPNKGKETGAYCSDAYGVTPVVLVNFTGNLSSVFTLAHELGHAMHSYYSNTQVYQKHRYTIFVAEVASTVNEMLLLNYLLSKSNSKEEKMFLYDKLFTEVKSTIFRQTMFAEFEQIAHEIYEKGEPLSKDKLCNTYFDLNKLYFGSNVKLYDEVKYEWARIPHFYNSFYVYKYSTGLISALSISEDIYNNNQTAINNYLNFLKSGSSLPPIQLLTNAGFDLTKESSFDKTFAKLKSILNDWKLLA